MNALLPDGQALDGAYRESAYLLAFPEIAEAVADGSLPSGLAHFRLAGRAEMLDGTRRIPDTFQLLPPGEARPCGLHFGASRDAFDEALYAALFPQVARQISQRSFASLFDHWLERGYGDTASGRQRVPFVPRLAEGAPPARLRVAELNEADYLMAFTPAAAAPFGAPALDPAGRHRVEIRQYRSLRFEALLARPFGVNVFAPFAKLSPLGQAARATLQALAHAGLNVDVWPYREKAGSLQFVSGAWTRRPRYRVNLLLVEPDYIARLFETFAPGTFDDGYTVALLPWQLCPVRSDHLFAFTDIDEVWTGCAFEADAVANVASVPVHIMPAPVRPASRNSEPGRLEQAPETVVFATLLGPGEVGRTTALAIIEAFRQVVQQAPATLVVAGEGAANLPVEKDLSIRIVPGPQTDDGLQQLLGEADCLIAGHPDAGGTWAAAAALLAGTPVIGMSYAGCAEFLDDTVGYPVEYRSMAQEAPLAPYGTGTVWAEASVVSLAARMREVLQDSAGLARRAEAACERAARFSVAAAGAAMATQLAALNLDVPRPRFVDAMASRRALPTSPVIATGAAALRPHLSFSLVEVVARDSDPSDLQAMVDAVQAQSYGLWELIVQPIVGTSSAVQAWLDTLRGSSPRISVMAAAGNCRPGVVERARGRYVVYSEAMAQLPRDTLSRMADILRDEPAIDIVFGSARDGAFAVRKQVLLCLEAPDLQPAEALSATFRARLQSATRLARSLPGSV